MGAVRAFPRTTQQKLAWQAPPELFACPRTTQPKPAWRAPYHLAQQTHFLSDRQLFSIPKCLPRNARAGASSDKFTWIAHLVSQGSVPGEDTLARPDRLTLRAK